MFRTPSCAYHPASPATGSCLACGREICDVCTVFGFSSAMRCVSCERRRLRRRAVRNAVLAAFGLGTLAFGGRHAYVAFSSAGVAAESASAEVVIPSGLTTLDEAMRKEPCDRIKIIKLAEGLVRADESRSALVRAASFFDACGDYPRLRWVSFEAHERLSEWAAAADDATKLIESNPDDADYRWWRGQAYEQQSDWQRAAEDFEQSIALRPAITSIPFNLANAYDHLGRPCDAIFPLEQNVYYYPDQDDVARRRLAALYANPACAGSGSAGRAVIKSRPGSNGFATRATIKGATDSFIVDTGASFVTLSSAFAQRAGIDARTWPTVRVLTAGGVRTAAKGYLDALSVQGVTAKHVECAISTELPEGENLLGMSFLSRFDLAVDAKKGEMKLSARADAPAAAPATSASASDETSLDSLPDAVRPARRSPRRKK